MRGRRIALVMAAAFAVYAVLVAWRGWDFVASGEPAAVGLGLAVLVLPLLAGWLVWREVRFGFRMQELGSRIETVDERSLDERLAAAQADPDDWRAWYWAPSPTGSMTCSETRGSFPQNRRGRRSQSWVWLHCR